LDGDSAALDEFEPEQDAIWMAETEEEATHVWCHKFRLAFFFSAMRHFRVEQREAGRRIHCHELSRRASEDRGRNFAELLTKDVHRLHPEKLILVLPGDMRVAEQLKQVASGLKPRLEVRPDRHFYTSPDEFSEYADGKKSLILEHFYRDMRRRHGVLMTQEGKPEGGDWNFDKDNRESFGAKGPGDIKRPRRFQTDPLTDEVIEMIEHRFADHPGRLDRFDLPVTHSQARSYLKDFVEFRLPRFGTYEDAMWAKEPFLYHSRLSAVMNSKLLSPRACVDKAVEAYRNGQAPLNSVEGFVRQILGWREFIRGIYWHHMPDYAERNALRCGDRDVPGFFWDGETDMRCVADCMESVLNFGWTHHIPRLMVMGQFALLLGVHPRKFHEWHMAMYVDAIDWVSLPNALGMSQYGDGGIVGTKPYCASGNYIHRMSNYCADCRYRYKEAAGDNACPFTTLYWDFLDRHRRQFADNRRMNFQMRNLERKNEEDLKSIRARARDLREAIDEGKKL
jgi:deoxyribodipyrimidine photolyase-related protein